MTNPIDRRHDRIEGLLRQLFPAQPEPEHPIVGLWKQLSIDGLLWVNNQSLYRDCRDDFEAMEALTNEAKRLQDTRTLPPRHTPPSGKAPEPPPDPEPVSAPDLEVAPDLEPSRAPARESTPGRFGLRPAEPTMTAPIAPMPDVPRVVDLQGRPVRWAHGPGLPITPRRR